MSYQIVYPITMAIDADSFKDAVKQYAKLNYSANIASLVITDRQRYMRANLKYYTEGYKNKVGISLFPTVWPLNSTDSLFIGPNTWPYTTQVSYDTKEYPKTTFVETPAFVPTIVPFNPLGSVFSATTPLVSSVSPSSPVYPSNWVPSIIPSSWSWPLW